MYLPIHFTPTNVISDDCWVGFIAILIALICWSIDYPRTELQKYFLLPTFCLGLIFTLAGAFCFLLDYVVVGKWIILIELFGMLILAMSLFLVALTFTLVDNQRIRRLIAKRFHRGIGRDNYFE